jgi:hypothetical protein
MFSATGNLGLQTEGQMLIGAALKNCDMKRMEEWT